MVCVFVNTGKFPDKKDHYVPLLRVENITTGFGKKKASTACNMSKKKSAQPHPVVSRILPPKLPVPASPSPPRQTKTSKH